MCWSGDKTPVCCVSLGPSCHCQKQSIPDICLLFLHTWCLSGVFSACWSKFSCQMSQGGDKMPSCISLHVPKHGNWPEEAVGVHLATLLVLWENMVRVDSPGVQCLQCSLSLTVGWCGQLWHYFELIIWFTHHDSCCMGFRWYNLQNYWVGLKSSTLADWQWICVDCHAWCHLRQTTRHFWVSSRNSRHYSIAWLQLLKTPELSLKPGWQCQQYTNLEIWQSPTHWFGNGNLLHLNYCLSCGCKSH